MTLVETEPIEEKISESPKDAPSSEGDGLSPLEEAKTILEENKKLLSQITEERKKLEKAGAEMMIAGKSFGGQRKVEESDDEKWKREAKIRYAGTGMDPT